ncbi:MAG TPA: anti-sigma factor [Candidatus Limnocylindrales bacterium]
MTHAEARELLELAAAEPDGLDRLAAGDTADSGALAGHLAGCDACREEYARLTRAARLLRANLATLPSPELRNRTLTRVATEGRVRTPSLAPALAAVPAGPAPSSWIDRRAPRPLGPGLAGDRRLVAGWLGSLAAAVVLAVGLSWVVVGRPLADQARSDREAASGLVRLAAANVAVDTRPDVRHVVLTSASGATGTLAFSPSARELVVLSTDLAAPGPGAEYRCWVEEGGTRTQLGRMYLVSDVLAWDGETNAIANVGPDATFGVSLVPGGGADGQTVLTGTVSGT